jgi:hypothetical protein
MRILRGKTQMEEKMHPLLLLGVGVGACLVYACVQLVQDWCAIRRVGCAGERLARWLSEHPEVRTVHLELRRKIVREMLEAHARAVARKVLPEDLEFVRLLEWYLAQEPPPTDGGSNVYRQSSVELVFCLVSATI